MLLTVPYTEGFVLEVDGQETEIVSVQDALCGVNLDAGTHEIVLRYVPAGFTQSAFITLAGLIALAAVCLIKKLVFKSVSSAIEETAVAEVPVEAVAEAPVAQTPAEETEAEEPEQEDQDPEDAPQD